MPEGPASQTCEEEMEEEVALEMWAVDAANERRDREAREVIRRGEARAELDRQRRAELHRRREAVARQRAVAEERMVSGRIKF